MYQNNRLNNRIPSAADMLYGQPKEPPRRDWRYTCQSKTLKRNALSTECFYNANNRLQAKIERQNGLIDEFIYQFDEDGHLLQVVRNGFLEEEYKYNEQGQRVYQKRRYNGVIDITAGDLHYNEAGQLMQAGHVSFGYDNNGALSERRDPQGLTRYCYGDDTLLDGAVLPGGEKIGYEYDEESPDGMARRLKGGHLSATYRWLSVCKLEAYLDYEHSLYYSFSYHGEGWLERVKITLLRIAQPGWKSHDYLAEIVRQERQTRLHKLLNSYGGGLELWCGCDQVGTPKLFTDRHGRVVKEMEFDSFGNLRGDSNPDLFIPIGFAGGLADPDTGLVRFGWRDYDPSVGRFTALDPARDMRGDGDLYDYCVDDPISRVDPDGLWTQVTFDESRVKRDYHGKFAMQAGGGSGTTRSNLSQEQSGYPQSWPSDGVLVGEPLDKSIFKSTSEIIEELPRIFRDKAAQAQHDYDRYGINKLADALDYWLGNGDDPPTLDWSKLMDHPRFAKGVGELLEPDFLFNVKARADLAMILQRDKPASETLNYLALAASQPGRPITIDFAQDAASRSKGYFQRITFDKDSAIENANDGLTHMLGRFDIRATPSRARLTYLGNNNYRLDIEQVVLDVNDSFDFEGGQFLGTVSRGMGQHEASRSGFVAGFFSLDKENLWNSDFRNYRENTGRGRDFRFQVSSKPITINRSFTLRLGELPHQ